MYYSILDVTPTTDTWIPNYLPTANALVAKHGGTYLARTANHQQVEGETKEAAMRIIIQWPSKEAALNFMEDPEYATHLQARTAGSVSNHYLIEPAVLAGSVSNHYLIEAKDDLA